MYFNEMTSFHVFRIYVEAQTTSSHGENLIFRKKLKNYEITYEISGEETTRVDFKLHLTRLGFELSNTLLIDSQMIYRLAIMNHSSRGNYIEQYCTPPELLSRYKYAKNKIEILQKEMKSLIDQKKQLKAAEKNEKTKIKSLEAFTELDRNFSKESQDYLLFHLFHNHRDYSELKPKVIEELKTSLNALKGDYATTLIAYRVANENYFYNEKILLKNTDDLRLAYCKKFKLQQEHEKNRQELDIYEMYSTDAFEDLYMKAIHSEIEVSNENCEKLLALKNKYEPSYDEYIYLRKAFNGKNSKFTTLYNILKKLIFTDLDETSESRKFFFHQLDMVKQEKKVFEEKFEALKTQQKELDINTERCKSQSKEMQVKCGIKKNCIARLEDASSTFLRTKKINDRVMLEKLKNKFSHAIVGRLSDLFEVQNPNEKIDVKHYQILERLGKFADAIVVDNRETCVSCEEFLKLHQHECVNVICLSLNNFEALPATEDLVKNYKLPDGVTAIPIENFIVAKHPEIHKLLMSILKPTLVSDSLDNLRIIFAAVDMKIQVTSFEWHMTKKPGSIVEIHQRYNEQYDFDDKTIQTIKENLQKSRLELVELIGEMKYNDLLLVGYNRKKLSLDFHLNMLESLISESDKTIAICQERIKVADENILRLTSIKELSQLKEQFKKVKEILTPFEHEFFKEFLQKYNFDTIDQYETEVKQVFPISIFNYRYNFFKSRLDFYESISMPNDPLFQLKDLDEMRKICDNSKKALDNFLNDVEEIKQKNDELNNNMKDSLKTTLQKRNEYNELEHKIETTIVKLCDELINIQIAVADNFLLLFHTLANCENVPLKNGESLMNLINIPNDVDGDSDFIYENLERYVSVNNIFKLLILCEFINLLTDLILILIILMISTRVNQTFLRRKLKWQRNFDNSKSLYMIFHWM